MNQNNEWIPNNIYAECMNSLPICCVDILLFNPTKTKVLLCKRNNEPLKGIYFSTGGRLHKGEELKDCAVRKAKEELGVDIEKEHLLKGGIISEIFPNSSFGDDIGYHTVTVYFGYSIPENMAIVLEKQHADSQWYDVRNTDIHTYTKERINTILQNS
ncbi:NUDIX domain-containing protein [bacterium]|nr:MAG: NUDIX domain-containing protein [bacterium]